MDLWAYTQIELLEELLPSMPPRIRGLRLMKLEENIEVHSSQSEIFNKYVGTDTLYIHTRCGGNNYAYFEMDKWEKENNALYGIDDSWDCTYRDTYISIPEDKLKLYKKLLKKVNKIMKKAIKYENSETNV